MTENEHHSVNLRDLLVFSFSIAGLALNTMLILNDMRLRGYCPYIRGVPSCDIIADGFLLILLSLFIIRKWLKTLLFSAGLALGLTFSAYFSFMHLIMANPSPLFLSMPTSWISLTLFCLIIISKTLVITRQTK